jgi:hypothetical protein
MMLAPTHPMQLALGLIIWSVYFVAIYAGLSLGCAVAPPDEVRGPWTWINGVLLLLTLFTVVLLLFWSRACWRAPARAEVDQHGGFVARMGAAVHLVAAGAVVAVGAPLLVLPPCV